MRSELHYIKIPLEIRIWAKSEKERDSLTQDVYNRLRSNQFGASSSSDTEDLRDMAILSAVPVDEDGDSGIKSMVMTCQYTFILGS